MELRQLRYFSRTAEVLNFSEAARQLCISQSTLSQQIKQLEEELDVVLFARSSHRVELTDAGRQLQLVAERALLAAEECKQQMSDYKHELQGVVRVGVTESCASLLEQPLRDYLRKYPKVNVQVHYTGTQSMQNALYRKQMDFAMAFSPHNLEEELQAEPLFRDRLCAIMSRTHALAERKELSFKELPLTSMVLPSKEMYARKAIDYYLQKHDIHIQPRMEVNDTAYMLNLISHSGLVTLQAGITAYGRDEIKAIPIVECPSDLTGCIFTTKDSYPRRSVQILMDMIREEVQLKRMLMVVE